MSNLPIVALVGRPNVGKSRLFNRLVGRRVAIVHDMPGVTRDLATAEVKHHFTLMDTGGIGMLPAMTSKDIHDATEEQVDFALQAASLILFVTDGPEGCTPVDEDLADKLRRHNKPVILVANKVDGPNRESRLSEFKQLGFGRAVAVSAEHGRNEDLLWERIVKLIGPAQAPGEETPPEPERVRICLAGKPNVGKSSLGNRLLAHERLIVNEVAGTTRDAIEINLDWEATDGRTIPFCLIDTAGLRAKRKVDNSVEYFSALRTDEAIRNADIVFMILDAMTGVRKLDKKLAGDILEAGVGLVMVVNKWDYALKSFREDPVPGFEDEAAFRESYQEAIRKELFFLPDSPVIFTSAKENWEISRILKSAKTVHDTLIRKLPTPKINKVLRELMERNPPKIVGAHRFKVYYAVQTGNRPFRIRMFCNRAEKLDDTYRRFLQKGFQDAFDLKGCPVQFELVGKPVPEWEGGKKRPKPADKQPGKPAAPKKTVAKGKPGPKPKSKPKSKARGAAARRSPRKRSR